MCLDVLPMELHWRRILDSELNSRMTLSVDSSFVWDKSKQLVFIYVWGRDKDYEEMSFLPEVAICPKPKDLVFKTIVTFYNHHEFTCHRVMRCRTSDAYNSHYWRETESLKRVRAKQPEYCR